MPHSPPQDADVNTSGPLKLTPLNEVACPAKYASGEVYSHSKSLNDQKTGPHPDSWQLTALGYAQASKASDYATNMRVKERDSAEIALDERFRRLSQAIDAMHKKHGIPRKVKKESPAFLSDSSAVSFPSVGPIPWQGWKPKLERHEHEDASYLRKPCEEPPATASYSPRRAGRTFKREEDEEVLAISTTPLSLK